MLKKNKIIGLLSILVSSIVLFSCDGGGAYQNGSSCGVAVCLYDKDNIESDIVTIHTIELTKIKSEEKTTETVRVLEGVVCSLRNDEIAKDEVLASTKSTSDGYVWFSFCDNEERAKKSTSIYYLEDLGSEIDAETNGTSKFYIIINDPELDGYDEKYETVHQTCATPDIYSTELIIKLGKNNK